MTELHDETKIVSKISYWWKAMLVIQEKQEGRVANRLHKYGLPGLTGVSEGRKAWIQKIQPSRVSNSHAMAERQELEEEHLSTLETRSRAGLESRRPS